MKYTSPIFFFIIAATYCLADEAVTPSLRAKPPEVKGEVDMAANALGINYGHLERMALGGNHDALAVIVALTFDGGAGEIMADLKTTILVRSPVNEVVEVLKIYSPEFRAKLLEQMKKDFLWLNGDNKAMSDEFDLRYSRLTGKKEAEKADDGQSAARSESKPEGGDKPQAEAEERAR
jgi:hypothetical protein